MNSISVHRRGLGEKDVVAVYDISGTIRCWGRRGILSGGLLGFVVGAIFVSNPPAADVLTFGAIGTLIVCAIECAVVGGSLGALLAAFNGRGVLRGNASGLARTLTTGRPPAYKPMLPATSDHSDAMGSLWQDTQTRPSTIRPWEDEDGAFAQEAVRASEMNRFVVFVTNNAAEVKKLDRPR
jgi:hypothetical protein